VIRTIRLDRLAQDRVRINSLLADEMSSLYTNSPNLPAKLGDRLTQSKGGLPRCKWNRPPVVATSAAHPAPCRERAGRLALLSTSHGNADPRQKVALRAQIYARYGKNRCKSSLCSAQWNNVAVRLLHKMSAGGMWLILVRVPLLASSLGLLKRQAILDR
jgi:hypothetical protein